MESNFLEQPLTDVLSVLLRNLVEKDREGGPSV